VRIRSNQSTEQLGQELQSCVYILSGCPRQLDNRTFEGILRPRLSVYHRSSMANRYCNRKETRLPCLSVSRPKFSQSYVAALPIVFLRPFRECQERKKHDWMHGISQTPARNATRLKYCIDRMGSEGPDASRPIVPLNTNFLPGGILYSVRPATLNELLAL